MSEGASADADRGAFVAALYERHGPRLYRYALMILADRGEAEDVIQQVFTSLLSARRPRLNEPEAFLRASVRNAAFSRLRMRRTARAAAKQWLEPAGPECSVEERAALERALGDLPAEQREVVHLHVYEGLTFREVAEVAGESINTVSARYRYALDRLRKLMA
jgi:RNA polymerase sigma-70 factor (ECF subfamily)